MIKLNALIFFVLSISGYAQGSEAGSKKSDATPFVFLTGPKSVIAPCIEERSAKSIEEAILISSTALAQKEFFCVNLKETTNDFGLRMCKDSKGNDLILGAASSKLQCLRLLDFVINVFVESQKAEAEHRVSNPSSTKVGL